MTQGNFFDAIGVADMEKVHSAVIGWMLSDKCDAFEPNGKEVKSRLLQDIFQVEDSARIDKFESIEVHIEWKNIDILIVTRYKGVSKCWVIENKIKSSQHSDQLNRYVKIMKCKWQMSSRQYPLYFKDPKAFKVKNLKLNPYKDNETVYCFLSLIEEKPIVSEGIEWKCTQYSQLQGFLCNALKDSLSDNKDYPFVEEYRKCIIKLNEALKSFLNNHRSYSNVFTDGWLQKEEKPKHYNGWNKYICDNGLETIFQKCFLSHIFPKTKFIQSNSICNISVSETHGTALVNFPYKSTKETSFGFQFQNGTFKIQVLEEYEKDDKDKIQAFLSKWEDIIPKDKEKLNKTAFKGWNKNESKEGRKAYISICKKQRRNTKKNPLKPWYDYTIEEIQKNWDDTFDVYISMMETVIQKSIDYVCPPRQTDY